MWALLPLACLTLPHAAHLGEWTPLFDGKSLAGWRANVAPESFTVADGVIRVRAVGPTSSHLFYVGDRESGVVPFTDFEFEATVRAGPNSNGGVFVHTDMTPRPGGKLYLANGYEVQLNSSPKEPKKTGSLYDVVDLAESPVDEAEWFRLGVVVKGKRITVAVDGRTVVDYTEPPGVKRSLARAGRRFRAEGGAIALQAHDPDSVWYFKGVRVRRLP